MWTRLVNGKRLRHHVLYSVLGYFHGFGSEIYVGLLVHVRRHDRRSGHLEHGGLGEDLGGHVAHAARRASSLLLDVVGHDAIVLVDDVTLEAVTLTVLNSTGSADVGSFTWGQKQADKYTGETESKNAVKKDRYHSGKIDR